MSAGHTPGPWVASKADMFGDHNIQSADGVKNDTNHSAIAAVVSNLRGPLEVEANARLIAAAPELLEELEECASDLEAEIEARRGAVLERTMERDLATVARARAIIAKATGQ